MDQKTWMQAVSEAKISADLAYQHFDVFNQETGKAPFDKIAYKNGKLFKISVKSCLAINGQKYNVQLKTSRSSGIKLFDPKEVDIVAIYLFDIDRICYVPSLEINSRRNLLLRLKCTKFNNKNKSQYIVDNYKNMPLWCNG